MRKYIWTIFIDSLLILSAFMYYFGTIHTLFNSIITAIGLTLWAIVKFSIPLTFLVRDETWKQVIIENENNKTNWFKYYDLITDLLMYLGCILNNWYEVLFLLLVFKIKEFLISIGYNAIDEAKNKIERESNESSNKK